MKYEKLIEEIVNSLLDETTLLRAYKEKFLSPSDIKAMSALRKEASSRLGQRIGIASAHGREDEEYLTSVAYGPYIISQNIKSDRKPGAHTSLRYNREPVNDSDKLRRKLYHEKPFVELNVSTGAKTEKIKPTLGHELGHIVDPVQNDPFHAKSDLEGRNEARASYRGTEPSENEIAMLKSEGRAWRVGRDLQRATGTFNPTQWEGNARKSLRSYSGPYKKG